MHALLHATHHLKHVGRHWRYDTSVVIVRGEQSILLQAAQNAERLAAQAQSHDRRVNLHRHTSERDLVLMPYTA